MIDYTYIIMGNQVAINMKDGSTFFVTFYPNKAAYITYQPDDKHFPEAVCTGDIPSDFKEVN